MLGCVYEINSSPSLSEPRSKTNFVDGTILDLRRRNENAEARPATTESPGGRKDGDRQREREEMSPFFGPRD